MPRPSARALAAGALTTAAVGGGVYATRGGPPPAPPPAPVALEALWSQLVASSGGSAVEARWVLSGSGKDCTTWSVRDGGGVTVKGAPRGSGSATFGGVLVCSARLAPSFTSGDLIDPSGTSAGAVSGWGHVTAQVAAGKPVVILGDTGCRSASGNNTTCQSAWGFQGVLRDAVAQQPALFVHVGDYRYLQEQQSTPDTWANWKTEFFSVETPHAGAAPWLLSRGNHEGCGNGKKDHGEGWWLLFGPTAQTACSASAPIHPTWHVDVPAGAETHRFVLIDTSEETNDSHLQQGFKDALGLTGSTSTTWWVHHHPLLAPLGTGSSPDTSDVRDAFAVAMGARSTPGPLCASGVCQPSGFLVGHEHLYGTVHLSGAAGPAWPGQWIVGNGGVELRGAGLDTPDCKAALSVTTDKTPIPLSAAVDYVKQHGYLEMTLGTAAGQTATWSPRFPQGGGVGAGTGACTVKGQPQTWTVTSTTALPLGFSP